jgi:hypothetical protein
MAVADYEGNAEPFAFNLDSREFTHGPDLSQWDVPLVPQKSAPKKSKSWPTWVRKFLWVLIPFYIIAIGGLMFDTAGGGLLYALAVVIGTIALHRFLKRKKKHDYHNQNQ